MRRMTVAVALALCLAGCGSRPVSLITGTGNLPAGSCYTDSAAGPLVADARFGTAIIDGDLHATTPTAVMWRVGFTARTAGSQVEVLDPNGNVVATTGRSYRLAGGYTSASPTGDGVFFACGFVIPQ